MSGVSPKSVRPTSMGSSNATSSRALAAGPSLFDLLESETTNHCGPEAAPASHSQQPGSERDTPTNATCGQSGTGSSKRADRKKSGVSKSHPQKLSALSLRLLSLSRFKPGSSPEQTCSQNDSLQAALSTFIPDGSPEFVQTWRRRITPCGLQYWEHTASGRRISDSDCSGWRTPAAANGEGGPLSLEKMHTDSIITLQAQAGLLAGWPTPNVPNGGRSASPESMSSTGITPEGKKRQVDLNYAAEMAGWPPMAGSPATDTYNEAGNTDSGRKTVELVQGWNTPRSSDTWRQRTEEAIAKAKENGGSGSLEDDAQQVSGWNTPRATDGSKGGPNQTGGALPAARDHKSEEATADFNEERDAHPRGKPLSYQATLGPTPDSSTAETGKPVAYRLNPLFSLWLMGYPVAWAYCGARAMQSIRGQRPRSSKRALKAA